MSQSVQNVTDLLNGSTMLSANALNVLNVHTIEAAIRDALGKPVLGTAATEVLLVSLMIDDSTSIRMAGNTQAIRDGVNSVIDALRGAGSAMDIQLFMRLLNGDIIHPFGPLDTVPILDSTNYNPCHGTPLYDESVSFLKAVIVKSEEFGSWNVPVRTMSFIITDGQDEHSRKQTAASVATVMNDMLATEDHIIAGMGVNAQGGVNFTDVFQEMGIKKEWIYDTGPQVGESHDEFLRRIRRGFQLFSKSAVRASRSAVNFSQVGGFGI